MMKNNLIDRAKYYSSLEQKYAIKVLELLVQINKTKAYIDYSYSTLTKFVIHELGFTEDQAYRRVKAALAMTHIPEVKKKLERKEIKLSVASELGRVIESNPKISSKKKKDLLNKFTGISFYDSKTLKDDLLGLTPSKNTFSKQPDNKLRLHVTLNKETSLKLTSLTQKLSNKGLFKYEDVIDYAINHLHGHLSKDVKTIKQRPSKKARYISAEVKRKIKEEANYQCEFTSRHGKRCMEKKFLEIDHKVPVAFGGSGNHENLQLLCSRHHKLVTEEQFLFFC